jgi:hypothetical protein
VSLIDIKCVTPGEGAFMHRFYDTSPISPSGKFIAVMKFPYEDKSPRPGDYARVLVLKLEDSSVVYESETAAWDTQVGSHLQWGATDSELFFNRMDASEWLPYGVKVDILNESEVVLGGTVYMVSPDGTKCLSPCLRRISLAQAGYGVSVPENTIPENEGASALDGIYLTDTQTGSSKLLISIYSIVDELVDAFIDIDLTKGSFYGFHTKWSPDGEKILFILRWLAKGERKTKNYLITMNADGSNIKLALSAKRWVGGHHPNWCPDSISIIMNLMYRDSDAHLHRLKNLMERVSRKFKIRYFTNAEHLRLAKIAFDGSKITLLSKTIYGSGHPTLHSSNGFVVTDAYPSERVSFSDGDTPLRMIKLADDKEILLAKLDTTPFFSGDNSEWRIDPHPAWDNSGRFLTFNAALNGIRKVYVADFYNLLVDRETEV